MNDDWIREQARRHRQEDEQQRREAGEAERQQAEQAQFMRQHLSSLWSSFGESLRQRAEVYNTAYGKKVIFVEVHADRASVRGERSGRSLTVQLRVDFDSGSVTSRVYKRMRSGGHSEGGLLNTPHIRATRDREGLEWSHGGAVVSSQQVADVVMRELIDSLSKDY